MPITPARARDLALALPQTTEAPHFDRLAFRTPRKIFATLKPAANDINVMLTPELQDLYCSQASAALTPVPGAWGRNGATRCDMQHIDEDTLRAILTAAHALAGPKPKRPARAKKA